MVTCPQAIDSGMSRVFRFVRATDVDAPREALFRWHANPSAFARLAPPWESVEMAREPAFAAGGRASIRMRLGPVRMGWIARYERVDPAFGFVDVQESGPFASWRHEHRMLVVDGVRSRLEDEVVYELPLGWLGAFFGGGLVRRKIDRLFRWRHAVTRQEVLLLAREKKSMRILVTGAGGLVGRELLESLKTGGHQPFAAVRGREAGEGEIAWDPAEGFADPSLLEGFDALVHLAGENIASGRWSEAKKRRIRESRTIPTGKLAAALAKLERKPQVFVCASAVGYYGSRGDEILTEDSAPGDDFLADVCREWEEAARPAAEAGVRVVNLRFGVILSSRGGALRKMLLPFKLGAGGRVGPGSQAMSWISLDDAVGAIRHAIATGSLEGPVNAVSPNPVANAEFSGTLGRVLRRPAILPLPAFAARLLFGEMADALLLSSQRAIPSKLLDSGYRFAHPDLEPALRHLLGKP